MEFIFTTVLPFIALSYPSCLASHHSRRCFPSVSCIASMCECVCVWRGLGGEKGYVRLSAQTHVHTCTVFVKLWTCHSFHFNSFLSLSVSLFHEHLYRERQGTRGITTDRVKFINKDKHSHTQTHTFTPAVCHFLYSKLPQNEGVRLTSRY